LYDENQKIKGYANWSFNGSNQDKAPKNQFVSDFLTVYNYNVKNGVGDNLKTAAKATDYTLNLWKTEKGSSFETTFD